MNAKLRDHILTVIISLLIAGIVWRLADIIPQPVTYNGIEIGDIGIPFFNLQNWLERKSIPTLQAYSGDAITNITANPFTTSIIIAPLLLIPDRWISPFFSALSAGLLAYGILRKREYWRLLVFFSFPFIAAVFDTQWSPLFASALYLPFLLPVAIAKPQLGLALAVAGHWKKETVFFTLGIFILSVILYPSWFPDYIKMGALQSYLGWIPVLVFGGIVLLLAVLHWRKSQGRLLLAMSIIPQRLWYDPFLTLFVSRNVREQIILIVGSWIAVILSKSLGWITNFSDQDYRAEFLVVLFLYIPSLIMVLMNKDFEEPTPLVKWIDKILSLIMTNILKLKSYL
jgi:hypothetical protein